jgi:cytosine/adenosine deaminase-related metal-dependent hydrolase
VVANRPIGALVFSAHGTDADTVVVDGRVVLRSGELASFDGEREVLAEATRRAAEVIGRAGLSERAYAHWRHDH